MREEAQQHRMPDFYLVAHVEHEIVVVARCETYAEARAVQRAVRRSVISDRGCVKTDQVQILGGYE